MIRIQATIFFTYLLAIGCPVALFSKSTFAALQLSFETAVLADGSHSESWKMAILDRHSEQELAQVLMAKHPLNREEREWQMLIQKESSRWKSTVENLNGPFDGIDPPKKVVLLFGNHGVDDGFTFRMDTICLDLSSWFRAYGDASKPENADRIQRILSHEYIHLLTSRFLARKQPSLKSPLDRTLYELYYEGLGNFYSLSEKWRAEDGKTSTVGVKALARNIPIFFDRLNRLATASADDEIKLRHGLSSGPFPEKWGALTIALWLSKEHSADPAALKRFIQAGPEGIPTFVKRHLPDNFRLKLVTQPSKY